MVKVSEYKTYLVLYVKSILYLWNTSPFNILILIITIPIQALLPSLSLYIANILINRMNNLSQQLLFLLLGVWGVAFLLNNIFTPLTTMIQGKLTDDLTYTLNCDIMKKSEEIQTIDYFEDNNFYNDIQLLSSEASWRPVNLLVFGTSIISNAILFISMLVIFASFHPVIALLMLLVLVPQGMISYSLQQQAFEVLVSNSEESRKLEYYSQVLLSSEAIKDVRLYNLYNFFMKKYTQSFSSIKRNIQKTRLKKFNSSVIFLILTALLSVGSFIYIIYSIKVGQLGIGAIMLFSSSIVYAINSMSRLIEDSSLLYDTLLYMEKFFKFIALPSDSKSATVAVPSSIEKIDFVDVSFKYPTNENYALKHISFSVNKGEKIAIVGENGAGKTTLIKLLTRFYNIEEGELLINNISISNFDPEKFRENVSAIFQDFSKFDLTLRENVGISNIQEINADDQILKALEDSGFESSLSDLNTILGKKFDHSRDLSGGQWQKVALARAFFSHSPILILDEPTAALDARTEYELFEKFLKLTEGKTVFFITHRLSSVRQADKILLLRNGRIEGFDKHDALMKTNKYYEELYTMQSSLYYKELN